jgi:hypothetical protein
MSSLPAPAPPASPTSPATAAGAPPQRQFIEAQILRTRRSLRRLDMAQGVLTLLIGIVLFLLAAAICDHWLLPGGLGTAGRGLAFAALVGGVGWYAVRQFAPLLRPINPVYAAHALEQNGRSFKNSLVNLLLFRRQEESLPPRVMEALEQQAARGLASAPLDRAVDHAALLKLGYALVAAVAAAALYGVVSPKNFAASAGRVLLPWSEIPRPSRVQIVDVQPGDVEAARGESVTISAEVQGLGGDDQPQLFYSTLDERVVDQAVPMTAPAESLRFAATLPRRGGRGADAAGVQQDLVYWIEAGDARSIDFRVRVFARPTLVVEEVRYEYPAYTGYPSHVVAHDGNLRALEGTRVVVSALANHPIRAAHVDFAADGRNDLAMQVEGERASAALTLGLRPDRRTPQHPSYVLRLETDKGLANRDPVAYAIDVLPDYPPEIEIVEPQQPETAVARDAPLRLAVAATPISPWPACGSSDSAATAACPSPNCSPRPKPDSFAGPLS